MLIRHSYRMIILTRSGLLNWCSVGGCDCWLYFHRVESTLWLDCCLCNPATFYTTSVWVIWFINSSTVSSVSKIFHWTNAGVVHQVNNPILSVEPQHFLVQLNIGNNSRKLIRRSFSVAVQFVEQQKNFYSQGILYCKVQTPVDWRAPLWYKLTISIIRVSDVASWV